MSVSLALPGGSPALYTIGGTRFWFNRLSDALASPVRYEGWKDMGNVVDDNFEEEKDELPHHSSRHGTRKRDRSLLREITEGLIITLDELSCENLRNFFHAGAITEVAPGVGTGSVAAETMQMRGFEYNILGYGFNAGSIVVKDITGAITYVLNTDYEVRTNIIGGYSAIYRKAGGAILEGDFIRVAYTYDVKQHRTFAPVTANEILGKGIFFAISETGVEWVREFTSMQLEREGSIGISDQDWSSFQMRALILDDSENNPTIPHGIFRYYGVGSKIYSGASV